MQIGLLFKMWCGKIFWHDLQHELMLFIRGTIGRMHCNLGNTKAFSGFHWSYVSSHNLLLIYYTNMTDINWFNTMQLGLLILKVWWFYWKTYAALWFTLLENRGSTMLHWLYQKETPWHFIYKTGHNDYIIVYSYIIIYIVKC